jgi:glutathione synthase/RimK-type ligase-like ATP-grasp enzyme
MAKTRPASTTLIAITSHDDSHLPVVQQYLDNPLLIIDPLAILVGVDLSCSFTQGKQTVIYRNKPLENVHGVWYRKPTLLEQSMLSNVPPKLREYTSDAIEQHCILIRSQFTQATWISPYYAIKQGNDKSLGLRYAHAVGLTVPNTLFTSDPNQARSFINQYPTTIVKSLARTFPFIEGKGSTMFFAQKVHRGEAIDLDGLNLAPAVFQQAIDADFDIRVNVVGSRIFASKITNPGLLDSSVRDWRQGHFTGTIQFEPYALPASTAKQCVDLTKKLGLKFGAIDLVRDKRGTIWFLEINPNGQWAFVDDKTANQIGKAIAVLLAKA